MEKAPDIVVIPCRACDATTIALADRRRPLMCAKCSAPYDAASTAFCRTPASLDPLRPRRPTDEPPLVM
jgi:hypothetical protein